MRTIRNHPHTGRPLTPIGFRDDGRAIWPILGASEDDEDGTDADDKSAGEAAENEADTTDEEDESADEAADGATEDEAKDLGDAGKQALDRMKAKVKVEKAKRVAAERALAEKEGGDEPADTEAIDRANARIIKSEVKAAAAGKFADPKDAYRFLDLEQFEVDDDGNVDEDEIADAIDDLLKKKPYLAVQDGRRFKGSADGGVRKGAKQSLDTKIAEATKAGDFQTAIALKQQRAADLKDKK